ncbi:MAG: hypothetical protein WD226_13120 [Planctomycetota bacterium]
MGRGHLLKLARFRGRSRLGGAALVCSLLVAPSFGAPQAAEVEHLGTVWTERANRLHRAFADADDARRAVVRARFTPDRFPGLLELAQAFHVLQGRPESEVDGALQRLVDGLDVRLLPGFLSITEHQRPHQALVEPRVLGLLPGLVGKPLTVTLTWQLGASARHGRQEPIGGSNFTAPGFRMFLNDPRRADDPAGDWELVPSLLVDGRRYVGMPVVAPVERSAPGEEPQLAAALENWRRQGWRSFGDVDALTRSSGAPFTLAPGIDGWRRAPDGPRRATVLVMRHAEESSAGPLTGWLGARWQPLVEHGLELFTLPVEARGSDAFGLWLEERRSHGPVVLVLRGDAVVRWVLARPGTPAEFDGVVLTGSTLRPSPGLVGAARVLWIGAKARAPEDGPVTAIEGERSPFLDEPRLPQRVGAWFESNW